MSGINFMYENLVDDSTITITTGAANAQFSVDNIKNDSTTQKFRSEGNTVVLEFDLGVTRAINTFAVVGDATTGLEITAMTIKTSVTNDFSGSTPITIDLSSEFNMGWEFITEVSHRYVEVTMTGNGSYVEVSNFFIGERLNLPFNSLSTDSFQYGYNDRSKISTNKYGQKFIDTLNLQKNLSGNIDYCTRSEMDELDTMFLAQGETQPLWIIVDVNSDAAENGEYKFTMYGYLRSMPRWQAAGGQLFNTSIQMEQVI